MSDWTVWIISIGAVVLVALLVAFAMRSRLRVKAGPFDGNTRFRISRKRLKIGKDDEPN